MLILKEAREFVVALHSICYDILFFEKKIKETSKLVEFEVFPKCLTLIH